MHEIEHYDFSDEVDRFRVIDLLTDDENNILMNMVDKCENLEFAKDPDFDACDYAFELEKCWKIADPEVITKPTNQKRNKRSFQFSYCFFSIITFCEMIRNNRIRKPKKKKNYYYD